MEPVPLSRMWASMAPASLFSGQGCASVGFEDTCWSVDNHFLG